MSVIATNEWVGVCGGLGGYNPATIPPGRGQMLLLLYNPVPREATAPDNYQCFVVAFVCNGSWHVILSDQQ